MNSDNMAERLVQMASAGLRIDPPPTEGEIDEILGRLAPVFGIPTTVLEDARKMLHASFRIRMEMGQTIKSEHVPWLDARRAGIEPFYWTRYRQLLLRSGWPPLVAGTLDRSMDELLDLLGDPAEVAGWKRRGLVVGDVQSGKTASYAALLCKAADAGYRMVVLLTGTLENVRRQTQERLDAAFVGLDSRDFLATGQLKHKTYVGVGLIDSRRDGVVFTSRDNDFRKNTATALNIALEAVREPVLVVSKKNKRVLESLAGWLRARNADRDGHIDLPMLLIDDEADNASINTKAKTGQATAINAAIRDLLSLFTRSSYVGFTATPFANIFIDPSSNDDMLGDDLFPRDFIHLLEPPDNYIGMDRLFPPLDPETIDPDDREAWDAGLRTIADSSDWLPVDHKSGDRPGPFPNSLSMALRYFLLACAVRDREAQTLGAAGEKGIHRSMLVNVSRFTMTQNMVADQVHLELERIRSQIRLYAKLPIDQGENYAEIRHLRSVFEEEFADCELAWAEVASVLHEAVSPIRVQAVNQRTGAASLDYGLVKEAPGVRVIAVGGNSLSRGLTLEGLCVSYFLRNSRAYDTLLQMGRWFGYRDGYHDHCRIWLTEEAEGWYRHVADATNELKRDFARMRRQRATPAEFGLRVRSHPGTLLITARNKMAFGVDVVGEVRDISLEGRGVETARLYADINRNTENFRIIDRFLGDLVNGCGPAHESPYGNAKRWQNVPSAMIAHLLDSFLVHPLNNDFQGDAIAEALREDMASSCPQWSHWTVVLPTKGEEARAAPRLECGIAVELKKRRVLVRQTPPQSLLVSGRKARVGSRSDVRHGLSPEDTKAITKGWQETNPDNKDVPEDVYRTNMTSPIIIVYLLRGVERDNKQVSETDYKGGLVLPALGLHFPGIRNQNAPRQYVKYRLNRVAQAELEIAADDVAADDDED